MSQRTVQPNVVSSDLSYTHAGFRKRGRVSTKS